VERSKKLALTIPVMGALVSALIAIPATSANAAPSNCSAKPLAASHFPQGGVANCYSGSGHFRALIYCTADPRNGWGVYATGQWLLTGPLSSIANCPSDHPYLVDAGYDLAPW